MELTLLQETSITLTELDAMDERRKWMYYYYIVAEKEKERENMEKGRSPSKPTTPSLVDFKIEQKEIEDWIKQQNEMKKEIGSDPK